jgi:4-aminobutyrate aminotransferase-like enzyme
VLAFSGSYHGLGFGALTATGRTYFRAPFQEQLADWARFLPFPHCLTYQQQSGRPSTAPDGPCETEYRAVYLARAREVLATKKIGAILVEPILGRGGEIIPPDWFLPMLRSLADEFKAVLIFDEIFTGFYRTGPRFACDSTHTVPDIICLGKALTSGFPLAACVGRADLMDRAWPRSKGEALHTSTFLGNPLGCRMALTSLNLLESEPWEDRVRDLGTHLAAKLDKLLSSNTRWGHRRGRGLMQGLEVVDDEGTPDSSTAGRLVERSLKRGLVLLSGGVDGNVMSFTPPFLITREEIDFALENLAQVLDGPG